ncbi:MAG: single-stranded-DNA-specific exonuclease RecJ, partial [Coriobacteriia bacterium]|nr:single-stranded-DNA-specific exonuclease RecJ [Coriobacteriia bacterium]
TDDRLGHIVGTIQTREPAIVYTYSRDTARLLVRDLRKALPEQAMTINYYHAGLNRELRQELEEGFYQGDVTCLVSTSAFGEGVNIANIRNLLIYHPPFSKAAFNQLAGRAGRDGEDAFIHLLFDSGDIAKSRDLLAGSIPSYERLADLYRYLMGLSRRGIEISLTDEMFAEAMRGLLPNSEEQALSPAQVNLALAVFAELELIEVKQSGKRRIINMHANQQKVELMSSSRYLEAFDELAAFDDFSVWLESAGALELEHFIQGPMQPQA